MAQSLKRKRSELSNSRKAAKIDYDEVRSGTELTVEDKFDDGRMEEADDVEWNGIEGGDLQPPIERPEGSKLKKPPTGDELRAIKDASDLFKSSSFKLQIDALLPNVRHKPSRIAPLEKFLFNLHAALREIPSVSPRHPLEAARRLQKKGIEVPYPLPLPSEDTNWKVSFEPPTDVALVGSWANKVCVKPKDRQPFGVDIAVEIPESLLQEKDYMNGRFFHKRAFYLATIAAALQKSKSFNLDLSYESTRGDPRLSKLVLQPRQDGSAVDFTRLNAKVCILAILPQQSPIPLHRLSPSHSNIRIAQANPTSNENDATPQNSNSNPPPTPSYNNALLTCLTPKSHLLATHELQKECASFSDALTLLRVWANQRGYSQGSRPCVRGFDNAGPFWSSVLALLLNGEESPEGTVSKKMNKRRVVGKGLSSYQLFKAALEFFAKHNFESEPVFIKSPEGRRYPPESFQRTSEAIVVDSSSLSNLLNGIPLGALDLLRWDATKTLEILNRPTLSGDPFPTAFLDDCRDLSTRFDAVLRLNLIASKPQTLSLSTIDAGSPSITLVNSIASLLRRGLGSRSYAVTVLHASTSSSTRPISQAQPTSPDTIFIGIIHNPSEAFRLADHGPSADSQDEAALQAFRDLWGSKSELRRFKDGRIIESVVWEAANVDEKAHIPSQVVRYLLQRHFGLGDDAVESWHAHYDKVLRLPPSVSQVYRSFGGPTGFKGALDAFDGLVKRIKALDSQDQLPLSVLGLSSISPSLRYSTPLAPVPVPQALASSLPPNARYLAPIEVVIEFEKSSKWPDELRAIQATKLALYERIASALLKEGGAEGFSAHVVLGDKPDEAPLETGPPIHMNSCLEVVTPEGWAFHLRIHHDRELTLFNEIIAGPGSRLPHIVQKRKASSPKDQVNLPDKEPASFAKAFHIRTFIHAPRHHRAIVNLCHTYTAFSGTVRLVKRWLGAHWVLGGSGGVTEEAVELLCASLFLGDGGPKGIEENGHSQKEHNLVPGSKERGFAAVVRFLSVWRWEENDGLFVPLYGSSASSGSTVEVQDDKLATSTGGSGVWRVRTELDAAGYVFTSTGPDLVAAHRIKALAGATWKLLQGIEEGVLNVPGLFIHPTDDYDFIIHLDLAKLPRYAQNVDADLTKKFANAYFQADNAQDRLIMPGFDPARMLFDDLQRIYTDTFRLFFDPFGGTQFGGVWDPSLKEPRPFRVLGGFSSVPVSEKKVAKSKDKAHAVVKLNEDAVIAEIERIGAGLIQKIYLCGGDINYPWPFTKPVAFGQQS